MLETNYKAETMQHFEKTKADFVTSSLWKIQMQLAVMIMNLWSAHFVPA